MKKLTIVSLAMLFFLSIGQVKANSFISDIKNEIKKEKTQEKAPERPPLKKLEGTAVSQDSQTSFYISIGNISDIAWTRDVYFDVAAYTKDKVVSKSYFDINGALVGTTSILTFRNLTSPQEKNIKKLYPDCTIGQVISFKDNPDNATDMVLYGVQFENQDANFVEMTKGESKFVIMCDSRDNITLFKQL